MKNVAYVVDFDKKTIEVFDNPFDAMNLWSKVNNETNGNHLLSIGHKKIKYYYGTIWYAYKWNESGSISIDMKGRWKDIRHLKDKGYAIEKKVFEEYKKKLYL